MCGREFGDNGTMTDQLNYGTETKKNIVKSVIFKK